MNDFAELLREALAGERPFDPDPGREALVESIRAFERRGRTVRRMAWIGVGILFAAAAWALVSLWRAPDDLSPRLAALYLAVFVWGMTGVAMVKMWFATMTNDLGLRKELKRLELSLLSDRG